METAPFSTDPDLLTGLNEDELQVLAEGVLSSRYQVRLNELLQRNREERLVASEEHELGRLLEHVDLLNVLKARAMYTLQQQQEREKGSQGFLGLMEVGHGNGWCNDKARGEGAVAPSSV